MRSNEVVLATLLLLSSTGSARSGVDPLNLYEWTGPAPIVVAARSLGHDGKHVEVAIERVFRGALDASATVRVDVRRANRERTEHADLAPLRLDVGESFLLLLEPGGKASAGRPRLFELVRGVRGARPLPAEGAAAVLEVVELLVEVQDLRDHGRTWDRLTELLDDRRPVVVEIALQQFVKFREGGPDHLEAVRPLLAHSDAEIRRLSSELIGQIVERQASRGMAGESPLREDLAARARRDPDPAVRIAAATALGSFGGSAVDEILAEMAAEDPDQDVRYVAETLIYDRRRGLEAAGR